ncbi:MAG: DUF2244 domain-containing protein [Halocynthiibacter sp.]
MVSLWPYRSLPKRGFVIFIGLTAGLLLLPLIGVLGTSILWALLPFILGAVWAIWFALQKSYDQGERLETLILWNDLLHLIHITPKGQILEWTANPYWVTQMIYAHERPLPHYLTLSAEGREVELGAFLTPEERQDLNTRLKRVLRTLKTRKVV